MDNNVNASERITRYINEYDHVTKKERKIKSTLFRPRKKDMTLSVFRTDDLTDLDIWGVGEIFVDKKSEKDNPIPIFARCDFKAKQYMDLTLQIVPETKCHPRHANVVQWPSTKEEILKIRTELASHAASIPKP